MKDSKVISGEQAFRLHDTYGFPLDLTIEIAEEKGLTVDVDGFNSAMAEQKATARASRKDGSSWDSEVSFDFENAKATIFKGYETLECNSVIVGIAAGNEVSSVITEGQSGLIVTEASPFYAEMGGQAGDTGIIISGDNVAEVVYTKKTGDGIYIHEVTVEKGSFEAGTEVTLKVSADNRRSIARNHTATHLLHKALKETLGTHVAQAGSLVNSEHLRFDFSHFEAMTTEQIAQVEDKVNEMILASVSVITKELPIDEAKKLGATAQFGEKYGDVVRVVSAGDYSVEFCGGTHLTNTSEAGLFKIVSEGGVAAGVRRIEAITGAAVVRYIKEKESLINSTAGVLKTNLINEIDKKAEVLVFELKEAQKELEKIKAAMAAAKAQDIMTSIKHIGDVKLVSAQLDGMTADDLKTAADETKDKLECGVVVLASNTDGKISFVAMATKSAVEKGIHSGNIIKEITPIADGRGGGKPDMAQGGGKDASKIDNALAFVDEVIRKQLGL